MPDQLHQAMKMFSNVCVSFGLFETIAASSANCNHEHSNGVCCGPQMNPKLVSSGLASVCISKLKQRLKRSGEHGSPCKNAFLHFYEFRPFLVRCHTYSRILIDAIEELDEQIGKMVVLECCSDQLVLNFAEGVL